MVYILYYLFDHWVFKTSQHKRNFNILFLFKEMISFAVVMMWYLLLFILSLNNILSLSCVYGFFQVCMYYWVYSLQQSVTRLYTIDPKKHTIATLVTLTNGSVTKIGAFVRFILRRYYKVLWFTRLWKSKCYCSL